MKILTIVALYKPAYKGGGPIKTVANMVETLSDQFQFKIITSDRDFGDCKSFPQIKTNSWQKIDNAEVYYATPNNLSFFKLIKIIKNTQYDVLYLNSFFNYRFSISLVFAKWLNLIEKKPIIIAPRGEFSTGALKIKSIKKEIYIKFSNFMGIYNKATWQASSEYESRDIDKVIGSATNDIVIAPNLLIVKKSPAIINKSNIRKNFIRVVFLSRISPKKNLNYLLVILKEVKSPINLSIYGPIEDKNFWIECKKLIDQLPPNITAEHKGELTPEEVPNAFMEHDVFFFPTRGENFGHVIFEALAVGTCVVLSDQTPWQADKNHAVETIPLENTDQWVAALERWANYSNEELKAQRETALQYAREYIANSPAVEQNRQLFQSALKKQLQT
ncbi:glycosyltransferase family 4 protein [Thiothrix lacustris]|uniref:glycosyltransferase family 4 protein n=1 Tax=Thiothrix lacustris TaxID=525917 RepID=UPI0027E464DE|nr:glycosyltransferase family 4 protein [Thiothrix lacustris]WMP17956.1 glycosyltransferase family 4 protein [Thiothrix lacustris]